MIMGWLLERGGHSIPPRKLLPTLFDDYFIQGKAIHDHYTRSSYKYRPLKAHTNIKMFSMKCSGSQFFNSFPITLCSYKSIQNCIKMIPFVRTTIMQSHACSVMAAAVWNGLPLLRYTSYLGYFLTHSIID